MTPPRLWIGLCVLPLVVSPAAARAEVRLENGFPLESHVIDAGEIRAGGPPRDAIPALEAPKAAPADASDWDDDEVVLGVSLGGASRAYPISILVWHELVNDNLGEVPVLVSFCPLCGTGLVFDRRVAGEERSFGVSGLLYRSDLLLYDRQSESLWSQISAKAVTGPMQGRRLTVLPSRMLPWKLWRERHPETTVLTRETGYQRRYGDSPYGDYALRPDLLFETPYDERYHPKMPTLGLRVPGGAARAYPAVELVKAGGRVEEEFAGGKVSVAYDPEAQFFDFRVPDGVEVVEGFWFAWSAFHPQTTVFTTAKDAPAP
jgi:hypothetical protein